MSWQGCVPTLWLSDLRHPALAPAGFGVGPGLGTSRRAHAGQRSQCICHRSPCPHNEPWLHPHTPTTPAPHSGDPPWPKVFEELDDPSSRSFSLKWSLWFRIWSSATVGVSWPDTIWPSEFGISTRKTAPLRLPRFSIISAVSCVPPWKMTAFLSWVCV